MSVENAAVLNETEQVNSNSGATTEAEQTPASAAAARPANEGDDEHDHGGKEGGYQRIKRQRDEARAREEYWRDRAQQSGAVPKVQPAPVATEVEEPEPKSTDFATTEEFLTAVRAWDRKQILKDFKADLSKTEQQKAVEKQVQERVSAFQKREEEFAAANPDYNDKVKKSDIPISKAMNKALVESEVGPAMALYLADNPGEAEQIATLSDDAAFRAMGKLEAKIEASLAQDKPATEEADVKPPPLKTAAPAPPTPIRKNSSAPAEPDLEKVPYKEFVKIREAQQKKGK